MLTVLGALVIFVLAACGQSTSPDQLTTTPDPAGATVAALQTENSVLNTQIAELNQVTQAPPTEPPAQATRILSQDLRRLRRYLRLLWRQKGHRTDQEQATQGVCAGSSTRTRHPWLQVRRHRRR